MAVASTPSEAAAAAADVLLLTGDGIAAIPFLLRMAYRTQAVIKQVRQLSRLLASCAVQEWYP